MSVLLVTVLLALVVDKLSEVRSTEEDQVKEKEELQKERKLRSEQINALRGPEKNVQRRTIRRLIRFQAQNPAERVRALRHDDHKNYRRQSSLPLLPSKLMKNFSFSNLDFGRASSVTGDHSSPRGASQRRGNLSDIQEEGETDFGEEVSRRPRTLALRSLRRFRLSSHGDDSSIGHVIPATSKKANPLRLMKEPSSFIDEQKLRMSGSKIVNPAESSKDGKPMESTAQSKRSGKTRSKKSEEEKEKVKFSKEEDPKLKQPPSDLSDSGLSERHTSVSSSYSHKLKTVDDKSVGEKKGSESTDDKSEETPFPSIVSLTNQHK